jgi:ubiquinone/menaquinone biosynthesis C-methylase UbiE
MPHDAVRSHWEAEPCGTRGLPALDRHKFFAQLEQERYAAEPYIPAFAKFLEHRGDRVLEVGVGAGTDFVQWTRNGARAIGVDLTAAGARLTQERLRLENRTAPIVQADAEQLPFRDGCMDVVYSFGVFHHSTCPENAFAEAHRVLRSGGKLRAMVYHSHSIGGSLLALRWLTTPRAAIANHLESPGTNAYTQREARALVKQFQTVSIRPVLGSGDLLLMRPSARYANIAWVWRLYPRWLIRRFGHRFGFYLLIEATR